MALGAIQAILAAGLKPGRDILVISIDDVKPAFEARMEGKLNATVECNPCTASIPVAGEVAQREGGRHGLDLVGARGDRAQLLQGGGLEGPQAAGELAGESVTPLSIIQAIAHQKEAPPDA
nr:hypothetical protein [Sorangium cellulosum]